MVVFLCAACSNELLDRWLELDTTIVVSEGRVARPTCVVPNATITAVLYPVYGVLNQGCNATTSYRCVCGGWVVGCV